MAIHVPFSQRPSGQPQQHQGPVYIGFETRRKRPKFNWWGFNGIFLFFLSLGVLSPITLLISLMGLRKRPRKMAVVGTGLSLIGTGVMAAVIFAGMQHAEQMQHERYMARHRHVIAEQIEVTEGLLVVAASEFEEYRDDNAGKLPQDTDGMMLAFKHVDPWKGELRYEVEADHALLRSAGPDSQHYTSDDLTYRIDGETDRQALLPIESDDAVEVKVSSE